MSNQAPRIAIIGYGTMGKEIEKAAIKSGLEITNIFDINCPLNENENYNFDVAIDFSTVDALENNTRLLSNMGKAIVVGTTGWNDKFELIKGIVEQSQVGFIYDSNFSIGMHIFRKLVELSSELLNNYNEYDIMLSEIHHKRKIDHPSGTALSLADIIVEKLNRKSEIITEHKSGVAVKANQLDVSCSRVGDVAGTHTIFIDSSADSIELSHIAKNRSGLAEGAIYAAKWIYQNKGFHLFRDVI